MDHMNATAWPLVLICTLAAACSSTGTAAGDPTPDASAIIVRGSEMSGTLLTGLRGRVAGMVVRTDAGACPSITFRGQRSMLRQGNPSVYVDGAMMADTCILAQIHAADVDFVEIYTGSATGQREAQNNPFGAIFVYRVRR